MKLCPKCRRTYADDNLNFCLDDGELLAFTEGRSASYPERGDPPPTIVMDSPRVTNPVSWAAGPAEQPTQNWQGGHVQPYGQHRPIVLNNPMVSTPSQTLALISLCLGIASITVGWCCSVGLVLSPGALITGFIALVQIKNNPSTYSGKGLAIAGIAIGGAYLVLYALLFLIYGLAAIGGALGGL